MGNLGLVVSRFVITCDEQGKNVISWLIVKGSNMTKTNYGKKSMGMNRKSYANSFLKCVCVCVNVIFASKTTYASKVNILHQVVRHL